MRKLLTIFGILLISKSIQAQIDTASKLEEVNINATRAASNPSNSLVGKQEIQANNTGRDLPYLLNRTPSTIISSDAGNGFGYTSIRIRGIDQTRINFTINGVPLNDAESHGMFWVDLPDFASGVSNIQVQRGVGTSTNGNAAFGSSINIKTLDQSQKAYTNYTTSFGYIIPELKGYKQAPNRFSLKNTLSFGTGKFNHWSIDGRLSMIHSDGYVLRSQSDLKSYYIQAVYEKNNTHIKLIHFSGKEITGQAWNGISEEILKDSNRIHNDFTYKNQVDNYQQNYYQVFFTQKYKKIIFNTAIHYTKGFGYYEEYKDQQSPTLYNIQYDSNPPAKTDIIKRKWLDNDYYGVLTNLIYKNLTWGIHASQYQGKNFGEIIWAQYAGKSQINDKYYKGNSTKNEFNTFLKYYNKINSKINYFIDVQLRGIDYQLKGTDENYGTILHYNQKVKYTFFNPKAGITYQINKSQKINLYYGRSNREPVRNDIILSDSANFPKHETLNDIEIGFSLDKRHLIFNTNIYTMIYNNQLVNDGSINDVGAYNRVNVPNSYRAGIEMELYYKINKKWLIDANINISQNKIKKYIEYADYYDSTGTNYIANKIYQTYKNTTIAFSPSFVSSIQLKYIMNQYLTISAINKYISSQYLDNTQSIERKIDASNIMDIQCNYSHPLKNIFSQIDITLLANNIFNSRYQTAGGTWGYVMGNTRINNNYYYPQALTNFLLQIKISF